MKKIGFLGMQALLLLCLLFPWTARGETGRRITVMVYMCGSNLESLYGSATSDLQEMAAAGIDGNAVSVLVLSGGSGSWLDGSSPEETVVTEIGARGRRVLQRFEKQNMGQQETLSFFLEYGVRNRPADRYALILWDHGGGPMEGVCWDELFGSDHLSMAELAGALDHSPFAERKLDWIGFDACLMSSVEVAGQMAPYADYMIASQAEEPACGWNYIFLRDLHLDRHGGETGRRIVETYFEAPQTGQPDLTLACVDLSRIGKVEEAMSRVFYGIAARLSTASFSRISNLRFAATGFGRGTANAEGYDLVDLISLTECYQTLDEAGAEALRRAVEEAVLYHRENLSGSHGLSVYHPFRNQHQFTAVWSGLYPELSHSPGYAAYVDAYGRIMTGEQLVRWNHLDQLSWNPETQQVSCALSPEQAENLSSARLVVLGYNDRDAADDSYFRVYMSSDVDLLEDDGRYRLSAVYRQEALQVLDGEFLVPQTGSVSYRVTEEGTYLVPFYPVEKNRPFPEKPTIGEYVSDPETGKMQLKAYLVFDEMTGTWSPRAQVDLSRYERLVFVNEYRNPARNEMAEILPFDRWPEDIHTDTHYARGYQMDAMDFLPSFSADLIYAERLEAAFEITDTQGNTFMTDRIFLDFDNFRAYTDVEIHLPEDATEPQGMVTVSKDTVQIMLMLENRSEKTESYGLVRLSVNGVSARESILYSSLVSTKDFSSVDIPPGETGMTVVSFDRSEIEGSDPEGLIRSVSGTYMVMTDTQESSLLYSFTSAPLVSAAAPEEDVCTELSFALPAAGDGRLRWGAYATAHAGLGMGGQTGTRYVLHLEMTNEGNLSLGYSMDLTALNGRPAGPIHSTGAAGTGATLTISDQEEGAFGRPSRLVSLAPREKSAAALTLTEIELTTAAPDVSLRECTFTLSVYQITEDGRLEIYNSFPVRMKMDISLAGIYADARGLPTAEYMDTLPKDTEKVSLFSDGGLTLYHERTFFAGNEALMLLWAENKSEEQMRIVLGHARAGDQPIEIGCQYSDLVYLRNTRRNVCGLPEDPWPETAHAYLAVDGGSTRCWYVTVHAEDPESDLQNLGFSFEALIIPKNGAMKSSQAVFASRGPGAGYHASAPAPLPMDQSLMDQDPEIRGEEEMFLRTLRLAPAEGSPAIREAVYVLFERISSQEKLAARNMLSGPEVSPEKPWLVPVAYGSMAVSPDGDSAAAVYPGIQLAAYSGEEGFRLSGTAIEPDGEEGFWLDAGMDSLQFRAFDNAMPQSLEKMLLRWNPAASRLALLRQEGEEALNADWAEMMVHPVPCISADSSGPELVRFLNGWLSGEDPAPGETFFQAQIIRDSRIRLVVEPLENPEDCVVFFFWKDAEGTVFYEDSLPLGAFSPGPDASDFSRR